jgi:hypothetical protein
MTQTDSAPDGPGAHPPLWLDGGTLADGTGADPVANPGILAQPGSAAPAQAMPRSSTAAA